MRTFDIKKSQRLRNKVLIYLLIPILVLNIILLVSVYYIGRSNILQSRKEDLESECDIMAEKISIAIKNQEASLQYQLIRSGLLNLQSSIIQQDPSYVNHRLRNYIDYMNIGDLHVYGVYSCNVDGEEYCLYSEYGNNSMTHFQNTMAYEYWQSEQLEMFLRGGAVAWRCFPDDPDHLYLFKYVLNPEPMYYKGVLCTVVDSAYVRELISFSNRVEALFDENGKILCGDTEAGTLEEYQKNTEKNGIAVYSVRQLQKNNWYLVMGVTEKTALHEMHSIIQVMFLLLTCSFLLFVVIAFFITGAVTRNIDMLSDNFRRIREGEKPRKLEPVSDDETAVLCYQFNDMQDQLEKNAVRMAEDNTLLERAEYNALIQQLNPHFLYNCLESISAMARMRGQADIVEVVRLLSGMLRQSLRDHRQETPLREELEYIRRYLTLQSILVSGSLTFDLDSDEEASRCMIPRLMLQPLVENAIVHGLKDKTEEGMIVVSARIEESADSQKNLLLLIMDNGSGDSEAHLNQVLSGEGPRIVSRAHIGINNIQRRIQILYGEKYGMEFESDNESGMIVKIRIPYHTEAIQREEAIR